MGVARASNPNINRPRAAQLVQQDVRPPLPQNLHEGRARTILAAILRQIKAEGWATIHCGVISWFNDNVEELFDADSHGILSQ